MVTSATNSTTTVCKLCNTAHHLLSKCLKFIDRDHNDKWEYVKMKRLCFICLKENHRQLDCQSDKCSVCDGPHHSVLHNPLESMYHNSNDTRMQLNTTPAYVQSNGATTMDT